MAPRVDEKYQEEINEARIELEKLKEFSAPDFLRLAYASQFTIANSHHNEDAANTTVTHNEDAANTTVTHNEDAANTPVTHNEDAANTTVTHNKDAANTTVTHNEDAANTTVTHNKDAANTPVTHNEDAANTHDATKKETQSANNNSLNTIGKIKAKHPIITYPDLYQLAGIVAVKELGGIDIEFVPGRTESLILPDEKCLPDVKQSPEELRNVFRKVEITEPKHIVALYGGLKLATAGAQATTLKLDNSYCVDLLDKKKNLSPAEKALLDDWKFHNCVQHYATHKEDFFEDYEEAHKKLADFGLPYSAFIKSKLKKSASQVKKVLAAQKAVGVGVAVAAAVVILSFFYVINRRTAKHSSYQ